MKRHTANFLIYIAILAMRLAGRIGGGAVYVEETTPDGQRSGTRYGGR